jgi:hypothetical protein
MLRRVVQDSSQNSRSTPHTSDVTAFSEKAGGAIHTEYWIPAEDLPEFNINIVGVIVVTAEFHSPG